jgi:hypothetical protein
MPVPAAQLEAYCFCDGATPPVFTANRGCTSVARNGAGDFQLVLDRGIATSELMPVLLPGTVGVIPRLVNTSATSKQLLFLSNAGVATDSTFYFAAFRVAFGGH